MDEIKETGGARIGFSGVRWPFATLIVNSYELQLKASIIGTLVFKPSDISDIQPHTGMSFFKQGIKISHNVAGYNSNVIFWTTGSPIELINRIEQTGFLTNTKPIPSDLANDIITRQLSGRFPVRTSAAISIIVIWNIFFLCDFMNFFNGSKKGSPTGLGAQLALAFVFLVGLFLLISRPFGNIILKPGRTVGDIKAFIYFIMFLSGVLFLAATLMPH